MNPIILGEEHISCEHPIQVTTYSRNFLQGTVYVNYLDGVSLHMLSIYISSNDNKSFFSRNNPGEVKDINFLHDSAEQKYIFDERGPDPFTMIIGYRLKELDVFISFYHSEDFRLRLLAASYEHLPQDMIEKMALSDENEHVRKFAALNPNAPPYIGHFFTSS